MLIYFVILKNGDYLPDSITPSVLRARDLFDKLCSEDLSSQYELFILKVKPLRVFGNKDKF